VIVVALLLRLCLLRLTALLLVLRLDQVVDQVAALLFVLLLRLDQVAVLLVRLMVVVPVAVHNVVQMSVVVVIVLDMYIFFHGISV
jgi:hypothetical protein